MNIKTFYFNNSLRNWSYLIWDDDSKSNKQAIVIDPYDAEPIINFANHKHISIEHVLNTHDHFDHVRGNQALEKHFHCTSSMGLINKHIDGFRDIASFSTPGHCKSHFVYSINGAHYFFGDLLFQGGVGRCLEGGDPITLAQSLIRMKEVVSSNALWYPGHDYIKNSHAFASSYSFFKNHLPNLSDFLEGQLSNNTFGFELKHNIFLWCLDEKNWQTIDHPVKGNSPQQCFVNLRSAKDNF